MGIPWYFYNIYRKYNVENDLTINEDKIKSMNIDHLFLDYNSMIHPCAHQILGLQNKENNINLDNLVIENCINYTRYILNMIKPKYLYIMIDGVAPRAKMNQQRERRYKSHFLKNINKSNQEKDDVPIWDSNKITPGTLFMENLYTKLEEFSKDYFISSMCKVLIDKDPGEGEHKIMKIIKKIKTEKICIYGLDADLIMLSLISDKYDNIILLRDNTFNSKLSEKDKTYTYLDIKNLKTYICKDIRGNKKIITISDRNIIYDYIFLCFLLGNDFVEHIPSLIIKEGGLDVLSKFYKEIIASGNSIINLQNLDKGILYNSINLDILKTLFYNLGKSEDYFFNKVYSIYKKNINVYKDIYDLEDINNNNNYIHIYKDDYIRFNTSGYKSRYYKYYGVTDIKKVCKDYITSIYWILGYYKDHCHENWSWYYNHNAVPFISDLFDYLNNSNFDNLIDKKAICKTEPVKEIQQLLMVLPKDSLLEILNDSSRKKFTRILNSKDIKEFFPNKIYLDMINKEYLWQSKIFLKQFNNQIINIFL
jgi:5'-3' exonuclease